MLPKIISFSGGMAAGKDTFGKEYEKLCKESGYNVEHLSFAAPLKDELNCLIRNIKGNSDVKDVAKTFNVSCIDIMKLKSMILEEDYLHPNFTSRDRTLNVRKMLQFWGTDVRRKQDDNYWVNIVKRQIQDNLNNNVYSFITDARFVNELEMLNSVGATTVLLKAPLEVRLKRLYDRDKITVSEEALNHPSETDCFLYKNYTHEIDTTKNNELELDNILGGDR